jgi:2-polyprenyl-3-methyl-5-hydroxy-6-metoxy-1,4-benzoquinol methylase
MQKHRPKYLSGPAISSEKFEFVDISECNACRSDKQTTLGYRGGSAHRSGKGLKTRVVKCIDCGLIFTNPMPLPRAPFSLYDTSPQEYFKHHDIDSKRRDADSLLRELEKNTDGRRLLDVGCGQGVLLEVALKRGWEPEGLDVSPQFAAFARDRFGVTVHAVDIENANIPESIYDVITMNAIVEHLPDPRGALVKAHRALKPNGILWIEVPNEEGLYYRIGNLWYRLRGRDWVVNLSPTFSPGHLFGFSPKSLRTILTHVGFSKITMKLYQGSNCLTPPSSNLQKLEHLSVDAVMLCAKLMGLGDGLLALAWKAGTRETSSPEK